MSKAPIPLEPAFVLRATPFRDTSLLVEAFTAGHGRVGLVARGVRSPKSRLRVLLQPFQPLLLSWTATGELGSLGSAEADGLALGLSGEQVFSGWYLNELLLRMLHRDDPHPELYQAYAETLRVLAGEGARALRRFELRLLSELGFGLDLPDELEPERFYRYDADCIPQLASANDPAAVPGHCLMALRDDAPMDAVQLRMARDLLRGLLEPHLGDRPLASAAMLRELRAKP